MFERKNTTKLDNHQMQSTYMVEGRAGTWSVTMLLSANKVSKETISAPNSRARASEIICTSA